MSPDPAAPPACDLQPDFPFDYAAHLAGERRLGRLPDSALGAPVAVVGAGGAGLCAAYELLRLGCRPVLYEAESCPDGPGGRRLGGRMHSLRLDPADSAVVELGCMRFPDSARLLFHYADRFGLSTVPFRENYAHPTTPVTVWDVDGQSHRVRTLADLRSRHEGFRRAHTRWLAALERAGLPALRRAVADRDRAQVRRRWSALVRGYEQWTFHRFLRDPEGAGMSEEEARLLATAGIGPAAWDCFFGMGMVDLLRLLLASDGAVLHRFPDGVSALAEQFWACRTTGPGGRGTSLEEVNSGAPRPAVTAIEVPGDPRRGVVVHDADGGRARYAAAVFTPQLDLLETTVRLSAAAGGPDPLGPRLRRAVRSVTYWAAAKTALVLDEPFWEGTDLDGVTLTDRLPRAAYTSDFGPPRGPGGRRAVLDLSFTWSFDAMKIAASSLQERVDAFVRELAAVHPDSAERLRQAAANAPAVTVSWAEEPNFRGIARFSQPGEYRFQYDLFHQCLKDRDGRCPVPGEPANALFLAGDDTSWSPGWLDHALATGINAAWGVMTLLGGRGDPDAPGPGDLLTHPDYRPLPPDELDAP
ncbi:flavin monoamine oxidase family protein [Kitasatospora sp. NPDC088783]|uniref:flavin monoamine oxidase family protein n=1 Tax=Kitasatospora sp. NPDC088783 TaxID=3364077 RepID=UPI003819F5D3